MSERTFYALVIFTTVAFVAIFGILMGSWLTHGTKTEFSMTHSDGVIINGKFSSYKNFPQFQSLPLTVEIINNRNEVVEFSISPIITVNNKPVYTGSKVSPVIKPNQSFTKSFDLNFDTVGFNSIRLEVNSNATENQIMTRVFQTVEVVTPERHMEIEDQKLYYSLLWIIAIPAVIASIKNLKDLFGSKN